MGEPWAVECEKSERVDHTYSPFAVQKVQKLNFWVDRALGRLSFELRTCSGYALFHVEPA
jgi:hypothetical protein